MRQRLVGIWQAVGATVALGIVSAGGDWVWDRFIDSHRTLYGLVHGGLLCLCLGLALAWTSRRPGARARGALGGLGVGVGAALCFYLLAGWLGWWAMLPAWAILWILASLLCGWSTAGRAISLERVIRGLAAGALSGFGFYFAATQLWMGGGANPGVVLGALTWMVAFLPGFLPLLVRRPDQG